MLSKYLLSNQVDYVFLKKRNRLKLSVQARFRITVLLIMKFQEGKQSCVPIFCLFSVCVGAQQRPPVRPPRPPKEGGGSYSDYPGLLVNKKPTQINRQENVQNNNLPPNFPKPKSVSNFARTNSGPIVLPAASSSYSSLPGQPSPQVAPSRTESFSGSARSAKGIPVSVVAAAELAQVS